MPSPDQCAVGTDGKLLDQSKITWYNDPDDDAPIAPSPATTPALTSVPSSTLKATTLRTFFKSGTTPPAANFAEGTRRSSRVSRPSKRVLDATNMGAPMEIPKRVRVGKGIVESKSEDEGEDGDGDKDEGTAAHASDGGGGDTDVDMGDPAAAEDAYASTKAMGDQD